MEPPPHAHGSLFCARQLGAAPTSPGGARGPGGPPPPGCPHLWTPAAAGAPPAVAGLAPPRRPGDPTQAGGPRTRRSRRPSGAGSPQSQAWPWRRRVARFPRSRTRGRCTRTCRMSTGSRSRRRSARRSLAGERGAQRPREPVRGGCGAGRGSAWGGDAEDPCCLLCPRGQRALTPAQAPPPSCSPLSGASGSVPHVATGVRPREWNPHPPLPSLLEPLKLHLRQQPEKGQRSGRPPPGPATCVTTQTAEGSFKQKNRRAREHCTRGDAGLPGLLSEPPSEPGTWRGSPGAQGRVGQNDANHQCVTLNDLDAGHPGNGEDAVLLSG